MLLRPLWVAALLLPASLAAADDGDAVRPAAPVDAPAFPRLGPATSGAAIDLTLFATDVDVWFERLGARFEMIGARGIGGYAELAVDRIEGTSGFSNLDAGVLYRADLGLDDVAAVTRAGVVVPTETAHSGEATEMLVIDPSDAVRGLSSTALRFAVAASWHGAALVRTDVGVDIPLTQSEEIAVIDAYAHVDVGVGVVRGPLGAAAELQLMWPVVLDGHADELVTVTGTLQYHAPRVTPFVGVSTPLTAAVRDHFPYALVLGARMPL